MATPAKKTFLKALATWLPDELTPPTNNSYQHRRLQEQLTYRKEIIEELKVLVCEAHEDARNKLRRIHGLESTLDPVGQRPTPGTDFFTIDEYPRRLPIDTLKGYFGELFAAVIAENFSPLGEDWIVPAFLFRHHDLAFDLLDQIRQGVTTSDTLVGRHGDDCLAFQRNAAGKIVRSLACEAKCTPDHQKGMVDEAHVKASSGALVPTSFSQIIAVLQHYSDTDANAAAWVDALRQLRAVTAETPDYERCDLISYICGLPPAKPTTEVIPVATPHRKYTGGRRLEAVEIHLYDVEGLIEQVYDKVDDVISTPYTSSRNLDWEAVLEKISPREVRNLYVQECWLIHLSGDLAIVGVRSLVKYREVQRRESNLQKAFIKTGLFTPRDDQKNLKIKFKHHSS